MMTIVPTIDVEGVHGRMPFEQMVLGEIGGTESWGVFRIARVLSEARVRGTFFVDVYEHTLWGEAPIAAVCEKLTSMGHDVELHTHPAWRDDPADFAELRDLKRRNSYRPQSEHLMALLPLQGQIEILRHGADCIERWTGRRPEVHRGGGYSINADTLGALQQVGIKVDSTMNRAHPNSKITWSYNQIIERDGVLELPVTVMEYCFGARLKGKQVSLYSKLMKTDLDTCTLEELLFFVRNAQANGLKFMNLFMHSYSLMKFDYFYRTFSPEPEDEIKLRTFLEWASGQHDIRIMSCAAYSAELATGRSDRGQADIVPKITANWHVATLAVQKIRNIMLDRFVS